jgi:hypothetical protein
MNSLSEEEKIFINLYKNYSNNIKNKDFELLDKKWTMDGTKEKTWIQIYTKLPIEKHIEQLLFIPDFNESTIISEMDTFISSKLT